MQGQGSRGEGLLWDRFSGRRGGSTKLLEVWRFPAGRVQPLFRVF